VGSRSSPEYKNNGFFLTIKLQPQQNDSGGPIIARLSRVGQSRLSRSRRAGPTILRFGYGTRTQAPYGWRDFGQTAICYLTTGDGARATGQCRAEHRAATRGQAPRLDVKGPDGIPGIADDDEFPAGANKLYRIPSAILPTGSATTAAGRDLGV